MGHNRVEEQVNGAYSDANVFDFAMYPNNQLKEQVRDFDECFSVGTLLRETFFTNEK